MLAIIGVASAIALPRYADATRRYRLDRAAARVVDDLELVRRTARASGSAKTVAFLVSNARYMSPGVCDTRLGEDPYAVTIASVSFAGGNMVEFSGYGVPDEAGTITITLGGDSRLITLNADGSAAVSQLFTLPAPPNEDPAPQGPMGAQELQ